MIINKLKTDLIGSKPAEKMPEITSRKGERRPSYGTPDNGFRVITPETRGVDCTVSHMDNLRIEKCSLGMLYQIICNYQSYGNPVTVP
jgi:hypothetical protein